MKQMLNKCLFSLLFLWFISLQAQTPGVIYKPAGNVLGKSVLDPNNDGYTAPSTAGFSGTDYGSGSELQMIAIPGLTTEPVGDLATGSSGGHTDIASNGANQSVYVLVRNVGGVDYLIVRFRLGGASTATKGYTLLIDTDGTFGNQYPTNPNNPGFEKEVVLETGVDVAIFTHNNSGATKSFSYAIDNYSQRSVALSTAGGNADYFYDFFVPLADIGASSFIRFAAATVTSAQSGITGTISDVNGVNDTSYGNNPISMLNAVVGSFPNNVTFAGLTQGYSFPALKSNPPVITSTINTSSTSISGSSVEANGTFVYLYKNGSATSFATATVSGGAWTATGISGLAAGDVITAKALATGKSLSDVSNSVVVTTVQPCYTPAPTNLSRTNGSQVVTGSWAPVSGSIGLNTVQIRLWSQSNDGTTISYTEVTSLLPVYVATNGTWSFTTNVSQSTFNGMTIFATATLNSCQSAYSSVAFKTSGSSGTKTATPSITTLTLLASPTVARSVTVVNNDAAAALLNLYINGNLVATSPSAIVAGGSYTFSYTGFNEGDLVTARAQGTGASYWLSDVSNTVTVTTSVTATAPVITGTYVAGSNLTVRGTSVEAVNSTITLYKTVGTTTSLIGTTTVDAYGNWSVTGLTLASADVLTAYVKATSKVISPVSNSVTVQASAPMAPVVSSPINAGATSISGTGGLGTVTVYIDGSPIGTTTGSNWTLTGLSSTDLYRGAVVTAKNTVSGIDSVASNAVTVQGVASFCITDTNGNPLTTYLAQSPFTIKVTAMSGANCTGSVFTSFSGTVTLASSNVMTMGGGITGTFVNGILTTTIAIAGSGTGVTLSAINTVDPTATGSTTLNITAITASVASNQTVCTGTAPANFTLTTNLSTIQKWQKSTTSDFSSGVMDIAGTTTTLNGSLVGNLTATTYVRAVLTTGSGYTWNSTAATISIASLSNGGTTSGAATVCTGTNNTSLSLNGYNGTIQKWQSSTNSDFSGAVVDINNTTTILSATNLTSTTYYRAVVANSPCPSANSSAIAVTVNSASVAGSISGAGSVCTGVNNKTLTLSGYVGTVQWQSSSNNLLFNNISGENNATFTATNLSTLTYYRAVVTNGVCAAATSASVSITIDTPPLAGSVSGGATVCAGTNSTLLTLLGNSGTISQWQSSTVSNFTSVNTITNSLALYTALNLNATTYFRAVIVNGACTVYSSAATMTVNPKPTIALSAVPDAPLGATNFTLPYTSTTGSPNQYSLSAGLNVLGGFTNLLNVSLTSSPISIGIPVANTAGVFNFNFSVRNSTTGCTSDSYPFDLMITGINTGAIGSDQTICAGSTPAPLTNVTSATSPLGSVTYTWESSTTSMNAGFVEISGATSATYAPGPLTQTTYFKRVAHYGADLSDTIPVTITVNPTSVAGSISGAVAVCTGTNSTPLSLNGSTGAIQWQSSSNNTSFVNLNGATSNTYTATNLTATTYYRAVVTSGVCPSATSTSVSLSVSPASNAGTLSGDATVCPNINSTLLTATSTTGNLQWFTSTDNNNFSPISGANGSTYTATNLAVTTYFRLSATSGACSPQQSNVVTVTVNSGSVGGSITASGSSCSTTGTLTLTGQTGSVLRWEQSVSPYTTWTSISNTTNSYNSGLLRETTKFRAVVQNGSCPEAYATSYTANVSTTQWNGSTWSMGTPDATKVAIVAAGLSTTSHMVACAMVVTNNAVLQVNAGNNIILTDAFVVDSGATAIYENTSHLIQTNPVPNSGSIQFKRNTAPLFRLDYTLWSSPVSGSQKLLDFSPQTLTNRFYTYNTNTNLYNIVASPAATTFDLGKGYLIRMPNNWVPYSASATAVPWTGTFNGVPNNGTYTITGLVDGGDNNTRYNAIGNPYPSPVRIADFVSANANNITGTLWFWRKTNDRSNPVSYSTCTGIGCTLNNGHSYTNDQYLSAGQGFFVRVKQGQTSVVFTNGMRVDSNQNQFFKTNESHRIWLDLLDENGAAYSQNMIAFSSAATNGYDEGLDGLYINDNPTALSAVVDGQEVIINARTTFDSSDEVLMQFRTNRAGTYSIRMPRSEGVFQQGQPVFLRDNLTGAITELSQGVSYTFAAEATTYAGRFDVLFQSPLSHNNPRFDQNSVVAYGQQQTLHVYAGTTTLQSVKVYDLRGRLVLTQAGINSTEAHLDAKAIANQVLLLHITDTNGNTVVKKVMN